MRDGPRPRHTQPRRRVVRLDVVLQILTLEAADVLLRTRQGTKIKRMQPRETL